MDAKESLKLVNLSDPASFSKERLQYIPLPLKGMQMKAITKLLVSILLCFSATAAAAPVPDDFSYCSRVQAAIKADALYQVHLSGEIIGKSGPGLYDLRLFDGSGRETPFTIIDDVPPYEETPQSYPLEITGFETSPSATVLTMKLPEKHRPISLLDLDIADRDFKKRVVLSVSRDGKTWQPHTEDSVYDFTSQVDLRKTRIEFARTDARFFRIQLLEGMQQPATKPSMSLKYEGLEFNVSGAAQKKDLRIRAVKGSTLVPAEKQPVYDRKTFLDLAPTPDKEGNTVIVFSAALPMEQLSFDVDDRYYYRTVNLYGSKSGKEDSYRFLAGRPIYRFPLSSEQHEEKNQIEAPSPKYAWYKAVVLNKSNPPLDIRGITVSWVRQNLYFIAPSSGEQYSLCYGNQQMAKPDYDIVNFVNRNSLSRHSVHQATLDPPVASGDPTRSLRERFSGMEKVVLKTVVVLLVVGMGGWLYTLLRKRPEKQ